jgi:hypothetical protein
MTPFGHLIFHFLKRMFSGEDEEGVESMSVGLGVVLAFLAAPGALASLFLLDKYSTLLQFFRGQRGFDPYRASITDEYFFIVLSMTITGLVMVLRWNRLFPDRRDFWNLAPLPIPIRQVFLANFTALFLLAVVFAIDVNVVSTILFPAFVTMSDGSFAAFFRTAGAHAAAVLSASLFSFFAVFALVGILMLVSPPRWFRAISVVARTALVVGLLVEFVSNLLVQLVSGRLPGHASAYTQFLPPFWFLRIYRHGGAGVPLAALAASIGIAVAAYSLCYRRHFLRLAESLETLGASRHSTRFASPGWLFRSQWERACSLFTLKVLLRNERHVVLLGAYLGIGLVMSAGVDLLSLPLLIAFFLISGLRFVFDIPAAIAANWVFRVAAGVPYPAPRAMARRFLLFAVLPWQIAFPLPWQAIALDMLFSALAIELLLRGYRKIAFTCSSKPETGQMVIRVVGLIVTILVLIPVLTKIEYWALRSLWRFGALAVPLAAALLAARGQSGEDEPLVFEDRPAAAFELLKLA